MRTKRESRTTFAWNEGDIKLLLAKHLYEEAGVVVDPSQIARCKIAAHESIVQYAVIIKEKVT